MANPMTDPTSQQAFVIMLADCVGDVGTTAVALDQIASKMLDHVHRTVSAEWVELACACLAGRR